MDERQYTVHGGILTMSFYSATEQPPQVLKTYRAALYIRLSKDDGDKPESDSVINQKRLLTHFADSQPEIESYEYYIDDGYSGASFSRPDFLRMMADIYSRKVNCVIVKDSSRFGRNASESGRYIGEIFPNLQVRYIAVNDAIDSGKSQGIAIDFLNNSMRGMINEYYVAANSESIRSTLDMERKKGDFIGSFAKYGYKKDPADHHKLVIDEEAAENIRLIFRMYLSGTGIRGIVRYLNGNSILNPSAYKRRQGLNFKARSIGESTLWSDKTIRRILRDEMYIGHMVQGKFKKISYKDKTIRACPENDWIKVEHTHEAIISSEDFERAQKMLDRGARGSAINGEVDLFAGLLRCGDCGHALIKKTNRNPNKTYVYYRCSTYNKCKSACSAHTVRYDRLYDTVLYCIQKMVETAVSADAVLREMRRGKIDNAAERLKAQLKRQEQEHEKIIRLMADLYPDYKAGILNKEQYLMNKQRYERAQAGLEKSIEKIRTAMNHHNTDEDTSNEFIEHFKKHGNIGRLTRPILTELVEQIIVHENGEMEIIFNFCDAFQEAQKMTEEKSA